MGIRIHKATTRKNGSLEPRPDKLPVAEHWMYQTAKDCERCLTCGVIHWLPPNEGWLAPYGGSAVNYVPNCWFIKEHGQAWETP